MLFQSVTVKHAEHAVPALLDVDIAEGAAAAASTLETARKGIIYEHQAVSVPAQRLTDEYARVVVAELMAQNASQQSRVERDAAAALRKIEAGARTARQGARRRRGAGLSEGPEPRLPGPPASRRAAAIGVDHRRP